MFTLKLVAFGLAFLLLAEAAEKSPRIMFGQNANYQVKFPHHVLIGSCGGSIINEKWILTSKTCISQNYETLEIKFDRFYFGVNVFSLFINNDNENVIKHPFSDIALIKLPVSLEFNEHLNAIKLYQSGMLNFGTDLIGVVPGFDDSDGSGTHSQLKYGMFQFDPLFNGDCKKQHLIDEFTQVCTVSYNGYPGNPLCKTDLGSGLVIGWDSYPVLFGVVSQANCEVGEIEVYTKVEAFVSWIETVTKLSLSNLSSTTDSWWPGSSPKPTVNVPQPRV